MVRVVLIALTSLFLLTIAACGGGGAGQEEAPSGGGNGKPAGPETVASAAPEETTSPEAQGNVPISGIVGEAVETDSFEYRVLDQLATDRYFYKVDPFIDTVVEGYSQAGRFLVVTYSVTNTSPQAVEANLAASVHARNGDGEVEVYEENDQIFHPKAGSSAVELAPRQMGTSQFIFDVPADVEPELITVRVGDEFGSQQRDAGAIDLTREDPRGPRPEEVLALQYEYTNMDLWEQAYGLFAQESKDRVTLEQYQGSSEAAEAEDAASIKDYAFPSVEVQGNRATIERVLTGSFEKTGETQDRNTQEAILEDEGWRILMREDQVEIFTGAGAAPATGETTQYDQ